MLKLVNYLLEIEWTKSYRWTDKLTEKRTDRHRVSYHFFFPEVISDRDTFKVTRTTTTKKTENKQPLIIHDKTTYLFKSLVVFSLGQAITNLLPEGQVFQVSCFLPHLFWIWCWLSYQVSLKLLDSYELCSGKRGLNPFPDDKF